MHSASSRRPASLSLLIRCVTFSSILAFLLVLFSFLFHALTLFSVPMSTTSYQYDPLHKRRSFRILYLDRAKDSNAPLSLTLRETLLDKARGKYDALSYVWGPSGDIKITCSGQQISIGPNCEAALRRLRSRTKKAALFVDAICIDQKNDMEKADQIKLMGDVYLYAKRVLFWLGPGSPRTDLAFKEIRFFYWFHRFLETKDHRPMTSDQIERLGRWVWQRTQAHDRMYLASCFLLSISHILLSIWTSKQFTDCSYS